MSNKFLMQSKCGFSNIWAAGLSKPLSMNSSTSSVQGRVVHNRFNRSVLHSRVSNRQLVSIVWKLSPVQTSWTVPFLVHTQLCLSFYKYQWVMAKVGHNVPWVVDHVGCSGIKMHRSYRGHLGPFFGKYLKCMLLLLQISMSDGQSWS